MNQTYLSSENNLTKKAKMNNVLQSLSYMVSCTTNDTTAQDYHTLCYCGDVYVGQKIQGDGCASLSGTPVIYQDTFIGTIDQNGVLTVENLDKNQNTTTVSLGWSATYTTTSYCCSHPYNYACSAFVYNCCTCNNCTCTVCTECGTTSCGCPYTKSTTTVCWENNIEVIFPHLEGGVCRNRFSFTSFSSLCCLGGCTVGVPVSIRRQCSPFMCYETIFMTVDLASADFCFDNNTYGSNIPKNQVLSSSYYPIWVNRQSLACSSSNCTCLCSNSCAYGVSVTSYWQCTITTCAVCCGSISSVNINTTYR